MAKWMGRTALELIGQGGFGHSFDPLVEDKRDSLAIALKLFLYVVLAVTLCIRNNANLRLTSY